MARFTTVLFILGLLGWFSSCLAPEPPSSAVYPQNAAVSNAAGIPHDSATSYFPASASLNFSPDSLTKRLGNCPFESRLASETLFNFRAPVLSNYYLGHSSYRLLWLPAFRLPVLLTLDLSESNGVLRTQSVNRYPEHMDSPGEVAAAAKPAIKRINELKSLIRAGREVADNTERLASATARLDDIRIAGTPLIITEKVMALNRDQIRQFRCLLDQANIWPLPACAPSCCFDGVRYVFEAHEAGRYKVIDRSNPPVNSRFSRCCRFLINLSPARPEARN